MSSRRDQGFSGHLKTRQFYFSHTVDCIATIKKSTRISATSPQPQRSCTCVKQKKMVCGQRGRYIGFTVIAAASYNTNSPICSASLNEQFGMLCDPDGLLSNNCNSSPFMSVHFCASCWNSHHRA